MRWHIGHTIPEILHHDSTYPELPRKTFLQRWVDNMCIYVRDGAPCPAYDGMGLDIKGSRLRDCKSQYSWLSHLSKILLTDKLSLSPFRNVVLAGETQVPLLQDKYLFWSYLSHHGIPVVPVLAHTTNGEFYDFTGGKLASLKGLFAKPAGELCGTGALSISIMDGAFIANGQKIDLRNMAKSGDMIFQPIVENHPELKAINSCTLNTLRIVTCIAKNGTIELWDPGMIRIGRANANVDNFAKGGIGVGIDENGRLRRYGYTHDKNWCFHKTERHPDSGFVFDRMQVPFYADATKTALAAHKLFPTLKTVGWDVAITPTGPLLLEGNHNWDMEMLQVVHHKGSAARFKKIYG